MPIIAIASNDPHLFVQVEQALGLDPYEFIHATNSASLLLQLRNRQPAFVILDTTLQDMTGLLFCRQLRQKKLANRPTILYLSEDHSAEGIAEALDSGADDSLRKPFVDRELAARVRGHMRRRQPQPTTMLVLQPDGNTVMVAGRKVELTRIEYQLIAFLSQTRGAHVTATELLQRLWNYAPGKGDTALVRNHIHNLRMKIEDDPDRPRFLISHHGRGYSLAVDHVRMGK
jgi:DNA-binding response OmpR family regulator